MIFGNMYELMVVVHPKEDPGSVADKLEKFIKEAQAQQIKVEKMGKKILAYSIAKQQEGEYFLFNFEAPPEAISQISQNLRLERETILRYLFTKVQKVSKVRRDKETRFTSEARRAESERAREVKETAESKAKEKGKVTVAVKSVSKVKSKIKSPRNKKSTKGKKKGKVDN